MGLLTATHCNALLSSAIHCNALQRTASHCNTLQHAATQCITLLCLIFIESKIKGIKALFDENSKTRIVLHCALQCALQCALHCVLQCALQCLQYVAVPEDIHDLYCVENQGERALTATHCNTLQHAATNCNTLQHTATPALY